MKLLALTAIPTLFKVKKALKRSTPSFIWFSCAMENNIFVIRIGTSKMLNFFVNVHQDLGIAACFPSWPIRSILNVNKDRSVHTPISTSFVCYNTTFCWWSGFWRQNAKKDQDICQDLVYSASWSSQTVWPIFKVKQVLMHAFPLILIKILTLKVPKCFVDIRQELVYAVRFPSWPVWPIMKVKQAPKSAFPPFWLFSWSIV